MRKLTLIAGIAVLAGCAGPPELSRQILNASMTGIQDVPGPGDPDGNGTAAIVLTPREARLCWDVYVRAIGPATVLHIHRGAAGSVGPPVVTLTTPDAAGHSQGCAAVDPSLAREIGLRAHDFYVNVHTEAHPTGAIRGQLRSTRPIRAPRAGAGG